MEMSGNILKNYRTSILKIQIYHLNLSSYGWDSYVLWETMP